MLRRSTILRLGGMCIAASLALAAPAHGYTISDGNSSATIDPSSPVELSNWTINGTNQLGGGGQESFYYSIGNEAPQPLSSLGTAVNLSSTNFLNSQYTGAGITVDQFTLITGGSPAALSENVTISNTTDAPIDIRFYQYSSINLNGSVAGNALAITGGNTAVQSDAGTVAEMDATTPTSYQGASGDTLLDLLNNGSTPVQLNDTVIPGSGNPNYAFEWDTTLTPVGTGNSSYEISINKTISNTPAAVPLPSAAWMALAMLGGLGALSARKHLAVAKA